MPDFEALIRHQQLKQPSSNKRLKIVDSQKQISAKKKNSDDNTKLVTIFFTGLFGAFIGAFTILFIDINKIIPLDFLKF